MTDTGFLSTDTGAAAGRQPSERSRIPKIKEIRLIQSKFYTIREIARIGSDAKCRAAWQNLVVAFYPAAVNERFLSPRNVSADPQGSTGIGVSFVCGSYVEVSVLINAESGSISSAKFRTNGCGFMIASADVLCAWLAGKELSELHGLDDLELMEVVSHNLGTFPEERAQCATVAFETLRKAMALYRAGRVEEFAGEKALICTCFGVSEDSIVAAIAENGLTSTEQVAETCRAGSGCGSCRMLIQELIDAHVVEHK